MSADITLGDNVHDLTRRHVRREGPTKGQWEDGLLDQLEAAVSTIGRDGAQASEPGVPVNVAALDLQRKTARTIRAEQWERHGDAEQPVTAILAEWAEEEAGNAHLIHITLDIIDEVRALLEPPPVKRRPMWASCYWCGRFWTVDANGDRKPAVTIGTHDELGKMLSPAEMNLSCDACGESRTGEKDMAWPLKVMKDARSRRTKDTQKQGSEDNYTAVS